jgi:hypothetical protein
VVLHQVGVLTAVSLLAVSACGDDSSSSAPSVSVESTAWDDAQREGEAFGAAIADLPEMTSLWNDLFSRFDSVRATIEDGSTTPEDLRDWRAFDDDVIELGKAVEQDRDQLAPEILGTWGRFAAAVEVIDQEVER